MKTHFKYSFFVLITILFNSCSFTTQPYEGETLPPIEFQKAMTEAPGIVLDVRTPEEFSEERIIGAINIDVQDSGFNREIQQLNKKETYYLYCGSGKRSATAMGIMVKKGFKHVYNLEGGLAAWKAAGLPVVHPVVEI